MREHFIEGGWGMWPVLVIGLVLLAVAGRHALSPDRKAIPAIVALGVVTLTAGVLGFFSGLIATMRHVLELPGERVIAIALTGFGESLNNVAFSLMFVVLAGLCVAFAALRSWLGGGAPRDPDSAPVTTR